MTQVRFGATAVKSPIEEVAGPLAVLAGIVVRMPFERRTPCRDRDLIALSTDPGDASGLVRCTSAVIFRRP
jgi:hypothetical protein